jgi:hypothetical protein
MTFLETMRNLAEILYHKIGGGKPNIVAIASRSDIFASFS